MNIYYKRIKSFILLAAVMLICFINPYKENTLNYKFGVIYSSVMEDKSQVSLYNSNGQHIKDQSINAGGLVFGSFVYNGIQQGDYVYYAAPIWKNSARKYTVQINKKNLNNRKINSEISPTVFDVDNKYVYSGFSNIKETKICRTDITDNKITTSKNIDGQVNIVLENKDKIYTIGCTDNGESICGRMTVLDKKNLNIIKVIKLDNLGSTKSAAIINGSIYILEIWNVNDELSNNLIVLNLKDYSIKNIKIPFNNLSDICTDGRFIYVTEHNYHNETTLNRIAKVDLQNENVTVFTAKNNLRTSYIAKNQFVTSDGEKIYIYDTNDFKLVQTIQLNENMKGKYVSFYIND